MNKEEICKRFIASVEARGSSFDSFDKRAEFIESFVGGDENVDKIIQSFIKNNIKKGARPRWSIGAGKEHFQAQMALARVYFQVHRPTAPTTPHSSYLRNRRLSEIYEISPDHTAPPVRFHRTPPRPEKELLELLKIVRQLANGQEEIKAQLREQTRRNKELGQKLAESERNKEEMIQEITQRQQNAYQNLMGEIQAIKLNSPADRYSLGVEEEVAHYNLESQREVKFQGLIQENEVMNFEQPTHPEIERDEKPALIGLLLNNQRSVVPRERGPRVIRARPYNPPS